MTDRAALVETYKQRQKDLSAAQERVKAQQQKRDAAHAEFQKTEKYLKNLECIAQLVGEVLQKLTDEKIMVKAASGPRYVVGCRPKIDKSKLKPGVRVTLDMTTYTIMQILPREVDPTVHNMVAEDPGAVKYGDVGGLTN